MIIAKKYLAMGLAVSAFWSEGKEFGLAATTYQPRDVFVLTAVGDTVIMNKLTGERDNPKFQAVVAALKEGDAVFANLEENYPLPTTAPGAQAPNTYMHAPPEIIREFQSIGINMVGAANNHTYDFGQQGVLDTMKVLDNAGMTFAGIGTTLGRARSPGYLPTPHGIVALISTTSTFREEAAAGDPRPDMVGRPGLNPLRFSVSYEVSEPVFNELKSIQGKPGLESEGGTTETSEQSAARQGSYGEWGHHTFTVDHDANSITVGGRTFRLSTTPGIHTRADQYDLAAITHEIADAKLRANYVFTAIHAHETGIAEMGEIHTPYGNIGFPAEFKIEFAHATIDAGGDAFLGHGPHELQGIEIYHGKPIFYGLNALFFQNDLVRTLPTEFYNRFAMGPDALPGEVLAKRVDYVDPEIYQSVVANVRYQNGVALEVKLTPVQLRLKQNGAANYGVPEVTDETTGTKILKRIEAGSKPWGTKIAIRNGIGYIDIAPRKP